MKENKDEKWKYRYINMAKEVATWSKDPSTKVGAVIIGNAGQTVSQGYNGFPRGIDDCEEKYNDRPLKYKMVVHAEMNAIYNAIHNGASTVGSTMYVTGLPVCHECAKAIIQVGIKEVVIDTKPKEHWEESCALSLEMFEEAGVKLTYLEGNDV